MLNGRGLGLAFLFAVIGLFGAALPGAGAPPPSEAQEASQLDALRQQCVAAALAVQRRERTIGALDLAIGVMQQGVEDKDQEIAHSRKDQEALLGALERLARAPAEALAFSPEGPVDRMRSGLLIAAAVPELSAQARELGGQLAALAMVRAQIDARQKDIDAARDALTKGRENLAQLVARRNALVAEMLRNDKPAASAPLGEQASDPLDLIKRADAALDQHDKDRLIQLRTSQPIKVKAPAPVLDPTKPASLRGFDAPHAEMVWPVWGELVHRFGEADRFGRPSQGLTLEAARGGVVVAPFDGRVDYIGPFRDYGLILIIRHAGGYHSLLARLGHVDVTTGQWVLAGEPVGTLPSADDKDASATFYLELRRDGRPVDPQSRLGSRDQKTEDTRVRE